MELVGIPRRGNLPGSPVEITAEASQLVLNFVGCYGPETLSYSLRLAFGHLGGKSLVLIKLEHWFRY